MALPAGLPGPRGAGPVTIQVSPSTYLLMMKIIELGVRYGVGNILQLDPGKANLQLRLDDLYAELAGGRGSPAFAQLQALQQAGFTEAQEINRAAGHELVLPS